MPAVLTVETGANVPNANSYVSFADALAYFQSVGDTVFTSAASDDQASALVRACYGLGYWLNGRWLGRRASPLQALDWPRCGVQDSDGYWLPNNIVPPKIVRAQCEIAKIELTTPFIQVKVDRDDMQQSVKVGPIDISYRSNAPSITYWPQIIAMVQDYALVGIVPINATIGLTDSERRSMRRDCDGVFGGSMNPFDFPAYFQLIKNAAYGSDYGPFGGN